MQNRLPDNECGTMTLTLDVNNHPGVMSHVCGLFARRAYNLEAIACVPLDVGGTSRIWLRVDEAERLDQVIKQLAKLPDVLTVSLKEGEDVVFHKLYDIVG